MSSSQSTAFEFIYGNRTVHKKKLRDVTDPHCREWVEFDATSEAFPVLHGIGHLDRIVVPNPPDGDPFEGLTLRLFDASLDRWSIWWRSTRSPGRLDPPVVGAFADGVGTFECDDVVGGFAVQARSQWHADLDTPVWRQYFSYDDGATWRLNWQMVHRRVTSDGRYCALGGPAFRRARTSARRSSPW